ncbi:hypothetical protein LguiB_023139 [Lonicera macranthoides]
MMNYFLHNKDVICGLTVRHKIRLSRTNNLRVKVFDSMNYDFRQIYTPHCKEI